MRHVGVVVHVGIEGIIITKIPVCPVRAVKPPDPGSIGIIIIVSVKVLVDHDASILSIMVRGVICIILFSRLVGGFLGCLTRYRPGFFFLNNFCFPSLLIIVCQMICLCCTGSDYLR